MRIGVSSMRPRLTAALVVGVTLASAVPARADAITHWNNIIANAVAANRPNPGGFMDMAVIQAAVYDAVQAIERRYEPYYVAVPNASGSSSVAAAKCAHDLLTTFYSTNTALIESVDKAYADFLTDNGFSPADPGAAVGSAVAALYVPLYRLQGTPATSQGGTGVGQWRPTPPAGAAGFGPWVPFVTPFTLPSADYFRIKPQPELTSERYTIDYNEVKAKGSATNSTRTPEEQDTAVFYSDNFLVQWHRTLRGIAEQHVTDVADSSRLFALASLAMGDAFITVWDSKWHYSFWRPITAIREGANDGNPLTDGETGWNSMIATPPYPDYTSGANGVTSATMQILRSFFGTNKFVFSVSSVPVSKSRVYIRFSDVQDDVVDARVWQGIHFRFADEMGRKQGERVALWVFENFLKPVQPK